MFGIFDADEDAVTIDVGKRRLWLRDLAARQLVFLQVMLVGLDMSQLLKQKLMGLTRVDHQSGRDASGHLKELSSRRPHAVPHGCSICSRSFSTFR